MCVRWLPHHCAYTHIYVYVHLSGKALFLGVCGEGVFDFKAQQMKPKTWEKLTKHTDRRWLMGREKWPVDQHHRRPHYEVPCLPADPHLLDITSRKSMFVQRMQQMGGLMITWSVVSVNDTFSLCSLPHNHNSLKHGRLSMWQVWCGRWQPTHYFRMPLWCQSLEGSFIPFSNYHCNSLISPSYPDASERHKKKSLHDSERNLHLGSQREKVPGVRGERLKVPVVWVVLMEPC